MRRIRRIAFVLAVAVGVLFVVLVVAFTTDVLNSYRLPSASMEPTLKQGTKFVTVWFSFPFRSTPQRGDVVVFYPPAGADSTRCGITGEPGNGHPCAQPTPQHSTSTFAKRVVGLPGETIAVRGNHAIVNGKQLDEPYIRTDPCDVLCNLPHPVTIPAGHYFMLGDNRGASDDSRAWGPVPEDWLIGRKVLEY